MSYGLKIINPSSELVISSDAKGLYCVGKATLQGSVVQPSGTATTLSGRDYGYSVYRISWSGPVLIAIDLPLNKRVAIISTTQVSSGVWEIVCSCGDTTDAYGFDTQYAVDVWAYGFAPSTLSSYGLALYDTAGALSHDLTRPNLLYPRGYALGTTGAVTIPSLTRPVAIGCPSSWQVLDLALSFRHWGYLSTFDGWKRTSSTSMTIATISKRRYEYNAIDSALWADGDTQNTPCFIIEGNTLP
jgi:hypothetical protein